MEQTLTIAPRPLVAMRAPTSRATRNGPVRLVATMRSQASRGNSTKGLRNWMPALFTRPSSGPAWSSVAATPAATAAGAATSNGTPCTVPPVSEASAERARSRVSPSRPFRTTVAPPCRSPRARANPMPLEEPVTRTVKSETSKSVVMRHPRGPRPAGASARHGQREADVDARSLLRRALEVEPAAERDHPICHAGETGPRRGLRTANAVVDHRRLHVGLATGEADADRRRPGVLAGVGERLGHEVVDRRLHRLRRPLHEVDT